MHLLWHHTSLGTLRALLEHHHCDVAPERRKELVEVVALEMGKERKRREALR